MTDETPTSYFRYTEILVGEGYTDQWGEYVSTGSHVKLQLREFQVIKVTPRGARIDDYSQGGRFISRDWNKQWASPTIEQARQSFIARKKRQMRILEKQLQRAKEAMHKATMGNLPSEVGWLIPCPSWARGTDPTAEVAKLEAKAIEHKMLSDWVSG